ncbi:hypothetical protein IHE44_0010084 [Lamprotornis superbus]|uniref:Uncharacterized protein n=1 Tax=Lamprotornis superbus TaxID=245042 RepID=A0A835NI00_9PASS|nr:hypothetical protein IHE44_0010084 [Lamprotornis superbus]
MNNLVSVLGGERSSERKESPDKAWSGSNTAECLCTSPYLPEELPNTNLLSSELHCEQQERAQSFGKHSTCWESAH